MQDCKDDKDHHFRTKNDSSARVCFRSCELGGSYVAKDAKGFEFC